MKRVIIFLLLLSFTIFATPQERNTQNIGLQYRVLMDQAIVTKLDTLSEQINDRLKKERIKLIEIAHTIEKDHVITLKVSEQKQVYDLLLAVATINSSLNLKKREEGRLIFSLGNQELKVVKQKALNQIVTTISRRIAAMGIEGEDLIKVIDQDRFLIEICLPPEEGKNLSKITPILSKAAQFEFKVVDDDSSIMTDLNRKNSKLPAGITFVQSSYMVEKTGESVSDRYYRTPDRIASNSSQKNTLQRDREDLEKLLKKQIPFTHRIGYQLVTRGKKQYYRTFLLKKKIVFTGAYIAEVKTLVDTRYNEPYVALTFTETGARKFAQLTRENKYRRIAITLDDIVDSAPIVQDEITGGRASITLGAGSYREKADKAEMLKVVLKAGSLPTVIQKEKEYLGCDIPTKKVITPLFKSFFKSSK